MRTLGWARQGKIWASWEVATRAAASQGKAVTGPLVQTTLQGEASKTKGRPVQLQSSSNQWHTPTHLVELGREVFTGGVIDLDPCSSSEAQEVVQARDFWTGNNQTSSLTCAWIGRVFVNPPFGCDSGESTQAKLLRKAVHEHGQGHCAEVLLLL